MWIWLWLLLLSKIDDYLPLFLISHFDQIILCGLFLLSHFLSSVLSRIHSHIRCNTLDIVLNFLKLVTSTSIGEQFVPFLIYDNHIKFRLINEIFPNKIFSPKLLTSSVIVFWLHTLVFRIQLIMGLWSWFGVCLFMHRARFGIFESLVKIPTPYWIVAGRFWIFGL